MHARIWLLTNGKAGLPEFRSARLWGLVDVKQELWVVSKSYVFNKYVIWYNMGNNTQINSTPGTNSVKQTGSDLSSHIYCYLINFNILKQNE